MEPKSVHSALNLPPGSRLLKMTKGGAGERLSSGFAHRFRPTYAGANVGHPCGVVGPAGGLRGRPVVSHISQKTGEMPRISCTQLWTGSRVRLSLRKGAGSSGNPRNYTGNRGCGAPGSCGGDGAPLNPLLKLAWVRSRLLCARVQELQSIRSSIGPLLPTNRSTDPTAVPDTGSSQPNVPLLPPREGLGQAPSQ